jgi:hypothetical protein
MDSKQHLLDQVNGTVEEIENAVNVWEWLDEQLSIECIMRSTSGDFLGAEILTCCGGPTVRVDTRWGTVTGHWGGDSFERSVNCDALNEAIEELYTTF